MIKNKLKQIIVRLAKVRYLGRIVRMAAAVWRGPQTQAVLEETRAALYQSNLSRDTLTERVNKLEAVSDGYGAAIRGIEKCLIRHEKAFGSSKLYLEKKVGEQFAEVVNEIQLLSEKLFWLSADNDNIRSRIEFIRKELMFELRKNLKIASTQSKISENTKQANVLNSEKYNAPGLKRLNLGCGHIPLTDYINVDARDLPGVDIVADVTALPYGPMSVDEIRAAHLVEHFSSQALKDIVLPYWHNLLIKGGELSLVAPDAKAMICGYTTGEFTFEELREVIFGSQEYDGDFHFTMLEPNAFASLLKDAGFEDVKVIEVARRNGLCYEFEILARK